MIADAVVAGDESPLGSLASMALADPVKSRFNLVDPGIVMSRLVEVGVPSTGFAWTVEELRRGKNVLRARVSAPETTTWAPVLDAVMSIAPAIFPGQPLLRMAAHIDQVLVAGPLPPETVVIEVSLDKDRPDTANALVADAQGLILASLSGLRYPVIEQPSAPAEAGSPRLSTADAGRLAAMSPDELQAWVRTQVCEQIAAEMKLPVEELNPRRPLVELGMDSILKMVIRRRLEKRFGLSLTATVFWQRPTIDALVEHMLGALAQSSAEPRSPATSRTLLVPGAKIHYEVAGSGPTLLFIPGGAADATAFTGVRDVLSKHYTVVTYDPRGISRSPLDGEPPKQGVLREHADDVQRLLAEIGGAPAYVFAHSGGAVTAMDYVVRHHAQVRALILFEPMLLGYLDPGTLVGPDVPTIYREQGLQAAIKRVEEMTGIEVPKPPSNPSPELRAQMKGMSDNLVYAFGHLLPAMLEFVPDLGALGAVSTRIIVGVGDKSAGQAAHQSALRLATDLRKAAVSFPGDHAGFSLDPVGFATRLRDALEFQGQHQTPPQPFAKP